MIFLSFRLKFDFSVFYYNLHSLINPIKFFVKSFHLESQVKSIVNTELKITAGSCQGLNVGPTCQGEVFAKNFREKYRLLRKKSIESCAF